MKPTDIPSGAASPSRRWPLIVIAAPAAVAIWSGWVGLGQLCGFGLIQPFPGIVSWHLDTAITLPVGVEAYGAFALGVWLRPHDIPPRARSFAKKSAIGALVLGCFGQVIYHLLAAAGAQRAPWPVIVLVSCMPVAVVGLGAGLMHLLHAAEPEQDAATATGGRGPVEQPKPSVAADAETAARDALAASITGGNPLSRNQLMTRFRLTRSQGDEIVRSLAPAQSQNGNGSHE